MSAIRFYFSQNGKSLDSHPLQGISFSATGARVNYTDKLERVQIRGLRWVEGVRRPYEVLITAKDFGNKPVQVKLWQAGSKTEYFTLIPLEDVKADPFGAAAQLRQEQLDREEAEYNRAVQDEERRTEEAGFKSDPDYLEELNRRAGCYDRSRCYGCGQVGHTCNGPEGT